MQIHRRSLLKAMAATALPSAAIDGLAAQIPSSPQPQTVNVVAAGGDRTGKVHSLGFSSLAFKVTTADTAGNLFVIEHTNLMPNTGPALHVHFAQEEWFYVMKGEVVFQVGEKQVHLRAGESVLAPRRIPHTFSAVAAPANMLIAFTPAGKMEQYFLDALANPKLAATADFMNHYEVQWIGPSPFWKS